MQFILRGTLLGQTLQLEPPFSRKIEFYLVPTGLSIAPPTGLNRRNACSHRSVDRAADRLPARPGRSPYARVGPAWGLHGAAWGLHGAARGLPGAALGLPGACLGAIWMLLARSWTIFGVFGALVWVS